MPCAYCERSGILIYPVRYAVACPAGASVAPGLQDNFRISAPLADIAPAKFTLRRIRPGYLYTYDEKRKRLSAYQVGSNGQLWKFDPGVGAPQSGHAEFGCMSPRQIVNSFCVDILHSDQDPATNLWIGWSSVLWTPATLERVHSEAWRQPHMRRISVKDMVDGQALHSASFATHRSGIADLVLADAQREKAFRFSNTRPQKQKSELCAVDDIVKVMRAHSATHDGYIVAVDDPVGVTNDLSELVLPTDHAGFDEALYRGKVVMELIGSLKRQVKEKAAEEVRLASMIAKDSAEDWRAARANSLFLLIELFKSRNRDNGTKSKARRAPAEQKADDEGEFQWRELITSDGKCVLDEKRLAEFPAVYEQAAAAFQPVQQKLENAHLRWLSSRHLLDWLSGVHDSKDIRSGFAYAESVAQCIGKAVAAKCCKDQLTAWLRLGAEGNTNSLYARALLFNQDDIAAAMQPGLKGTDLQLDNILSVYRAAAAKLKRGEAEPAVSRITLVTANILISSLQVDHSSGKAALTLTHLSLLLGEKLKSRAVDSQQYLSWLSREIGDLKLNSMVVPKVATPKRGNVRSPGTSRTTDVRVIIFEADVFVGAPQSSTLRLKLPGIDRFRDWASSKLPAAARTALVGSIVQLASLGFACKDLAENDRNTEVETRTKAVISVVNFGASISEVMAQLAAAEPKYAVARFVHEQWASFPLHSRKFAAAARWGGAAAGVAAAVYDFVNGFKAYHEDKSRLAVLYAVSGTLGVIITVGVLLSCPYMWPLMIISVATNILIGLLNSGALADWLGVQSRLIVNAFDE